MKNTVTMRTRATTGTVFGVPVGGARPVTQS